MDLVGATVVEVDVSNIKLTVFNIILCIDNCKYSLQLLKKKLTSQNSLLNIVSHYVQKTYKVQMPMSQSVFFLAIYNVH